MPRCRTSVICLPILNRLILLMFGAFHENQQHCKTILTEKLYWWKLDFAIIVVSHYCHLIKDYKRFIFIVMKDVFLLKMLDFDSGERCVFVRNAEYMPCRGSASSVKNCTTLSFTKKRGCISSSACARWYHLPVLPYNIYPVIMCIYNGIWTKVGFIYSFWYSPSSTG